MKLDGCVAVVIGGARGIGKAYCVSLLDNKVKVCCGDVLDDVGQETEKELQGKFGAGNFVYKTCNGTNDQHVNGSICVWSDILRFAKEKFGRLDIVVNNVGIVDETNWQNVLDVNMGTAVRVTNAALNLLGKDKGGNGGVLVHTASNGGLMPAFYCPVYCATKSAIIALTRSWTHKINYDAHGIRMFTMCPKVTETPFLAQNTDPTRVVKLDVLMQMLDPNERSQILRPEWVGEALIKGLKDDNVNGAAVQLLSREPTFHFMGPNAEVAAAERFKL